MGKGKYILFDGCLFSFFKNFFTKKTVKGKFEEKNKLKCVLKKTLIKSMLIYNEIVIMWILIIFYIIHYVSTIDMRGNFKILKNLRYIPGAR